MTQFYIDSTVSLYTTSAVHETEAHKTRRLSCGHELPEAEILRAAGSIMRSRRPPGCVGGGKRSDKPRCPCGAMTAKRAKARAHHCEAAKQED